MDTKLKDLSLYLPGIILIMLGILVVAFPMFLVALISTGLILLGVAAMYVARQLRKLEREFQWTVTWEPVDTTQADWLQRLFLYRRW